MKLIAVVTAFCLIGPTMASAYWEVQRSDKDVFGNINVTANSTGDNGGLLRFECGSSSNPMFVYLLRDSSGSIPEMPAKFIHRDANGKMHESDATLRSWNDRFVAVQVSDLAMLRSIADHMVVATKSIPIGVEVPILGLQMSDTFSSRGSTAAGRTVAEFCLSGTS